MIYICVYAPFDKEVDMDRQRDVFYLFGDGERERIEAISNNASATLSFGGLLCLYRIVKDTAADTEKFRIVRRACGKPAFESFDSGKFNISHSGKISCAAWHITAENEVGIDIECISEDRNISGIAKRFFSPSEREYVEANSYNTRAFFEVWTAKEAYSKYLGDGISVLSDIDVFELSRNQSVFFRSFVIQYLNDTYMLTVCTNYDFDIKIINDGEIFIYEIPQRI